MRTTSILAWLFLGAAVAVLLSGCGILNSILGSNGVPGANTQASQDAAHKADYAIWQWLGELFGVMSPTPEGPPTGLRTAAVAIVAVAHKHIARGVAHVARKSAHVVKSAGAGIAHAAKTMVSPPAA